ncbi:MAG: dienelactone hydrolase family protein [Pirellulaceae bacterium]
MFHRRDFGRRLFAVAAGFTAHQLVGADQASADVPWLDEVQLVPATLPPEAPQLSPVLADAQGQPLRTKEQWLGRRQELRQAWHSILGSLGLDESFVPSLKVLHEDRDDGVVRQLVQYEVEPGILTEAYVLSPLRPSGTCPGVAVFHSTVNHSITQPAGLGKDAEKAFGLKLAKRGAVAICPRNYLWPDNTHIAAAEEAARFLERKPQAKGMAKMLYDARMALNILARLPHVDPQRLGAVGHSLGAKEVLYLAALDDRVQATVSSEGGIGLGFSNWDASWYLGPSIKAPGFAHDHHELLALVAPRAFLLVGGESADGDRGWPYLQRAMPVYRLYSNRPRLGFYNHRRGHAVPPEAEQRIAEWLETYLGMRG